jgi:threonine dehydratase
MKMVTPNQDAPELAAALGASSIYLKREDLHHYGSHKGRSIPEMMNTYVEKGQNRFVISSSGNAALAAALHTKTLNENLLEANNPGPNIRLTIYVGNKVNPQKFQKLKDLEDEEINVFVREYPLHALSESIAEGMVSLRQSTDDTALVGYASLAQELEAIPNLGAIFIGTSSGTCAQALAQYFSDKKSGVQVHIVQTSSCHPMFDEFATYDGPNERSIADAIADKTALRKSTLVPLVKNTGGRGWCVTNDEIGLAMDLTREHSGLEISPNSALSVAGAAQAISMGYEIEGAIACMICGD